MEGEASAGTYGRFGSSESMVLQDALSLLDRELHLR